MSRHRSVRERRGPAALAAGLAGLSLALLLAGLVLLHPGWITAAISGDTVAATPAVAVPSIAAPQPAPGAPAVPVALDIPSIGAHSSLVATGLKADRTIAVPSVRTPEQAAWYTGAPRPGAAGPAVVVGHVNGGGRDGVFADLSRVAPGAEVLVTRADRSVAVFTVSRVATVAKAGFPTRAVYGDTPGPELRLITCGGTFDASARSYESNVVAYATLTGVRSADPQT